MTRFFVALTIFFLFAACSSNSDNSTKTNSTAVSDSVWEEHDSISCGGKPKDFFADTFVIQETHLRDTTIVKGNFILFLRPDSVRFESYIKAGDSWIYQVDSDFGFGISDAMDTLRKDKRFSKIVHSVCTKRYVKILDCKNCPTIIDRDSVDYGFILSGNGRKYKFHSSNGNIISSGEYYVQEAATFFDIRK